MPPAAHEVEPLLLELREFQQAKLSAMARQRLVNRPLSIRSLTQRDRAFIQYLQCEIYICPGLRMGAASDDEFACFLRGLEHLKVIFGRITFFSD